MQMAQSTEPLQGPWFLQEGFLCVSESVICSIVYDYQPSSHCPEGMLGTVKDLPISCCMPSCLEYLPTLLSTRPVTVCFPKSCQDSIVHHPPEKMSQRSLSHFWERHKRMGEKILPLRLENPEIPQLMLPSHRDTQLVQLSFFSIVVILSIYRSVLHHNCLANHKYSFPKSWYHQRWFWRNPVWSSFSLSFQCICPTTKLQGQCPVGMARTGQLGYSVARDLLSRLLVVAAHISLQSL